MAKQTVCIQHLKKRYTPSSPLAVDDLSLEAFEGEIVGILGQNGAGKTTTLKCLTGILPFESGEITVDGASIRTQPKLAKSKFGFVTDNHAVFEKMTGLEYVDFMADIYRIGREEREARLDLFQSTLGLGDAIFNEITSYSHGMKQKIAIMGALIHNPRVWILDEPATGLDPQSNHEMTRLMYGHRDRGNTVLFSSHNLDAVERLCDRVYIVDRGKCVDRLDLQEFKSRSAVRLEEYFLGLIGRNARNTGEGT